ncbi:MAG: ribulose-phosphate 3-epimerase [Cyanobacteria bacterium J06555_3]
MNNTDRSTHTLSVDIGGSGIKAMVLDDSGNSITERLRIDTPDPATPAAVMDVICALAREQSSFDRVSIGFPGVIENGVTKSAANLDDDWLDFDFASAIRQRLAKPVKIKNDAEIQGYGAISGKGVELVITLGTGFGSALFLDGKLMPNLELAHHNFRKGKTYEERLKKQQLKKKGKKKWNKRLQKAIASLKAAFHYDHLYIGGGRAKEINFQLPDDVTIIPNTAGILGGIALWQNQITAKSDRPKDREESFGKSRVRKVSSSQQTLILPSILSANFACLATGVKKAQAAGAKAIQIDIMDGQFVPNISFGWDTVAAISSLGLEDLFLDVHLMIVEPERYIENFARAGANRLIVHQEACTHLHRTLSLIRDSAMEVGVTINPGTSLDAILPVIDLVDLVQIMTVNPGFGGQSFIHSQLDKIRLLKQIVQQRNLNLAIAVDGGINAQTAPLVVEAGATVLIAGSSVYNSQASVKDNLQTLYAATDRVISNQ